MFIYQFVTIYFIGNLDDSVLLAGIGMAIMLINIIGTSWIIGLNSTLDTLISQSYGAKSYEMCGIYLSRGRVIITLLMLPITFILFNSKSILIALKQEPAVSEIAYRFCIMSIPGLWVIGLNDSCRTFLRAQFETDMPLKIAMFTLVIHTFFSWLLISKYDMREVGCAIANTTTYVLTFILQEYWTSKNMKLTYSYPDRRSIESLGLYLKIGVPAALLICYEWWAYEVLAILAGMISINALGAHVIVY